MRDIIHLNELNTTEKKKIGSGQFIYAYSSTKNPNVVYKSLLSYQEFQNIKKNPELLKDPELIKKNEYMKEIAGTMMQYPQYFVPVISIKDFYYVQEKADIAQAKKLMNALDDAIDTVNHKFKIKTDLINITNMENPTNVNKLYAAVKKYTDPSIYALLKQCYNITQRVKKLIPADQGAVDSHSGNFAVYKGAIKFIDF